MYPIKKSKKYLLRDNLWLQKINWISRGFVFSSLIWLLIWEESNIHEEGKETFKKKKSRTDGEKLQENKIHSSGDEGEETHVHTSSHPGYQLFFSSFSSGWITVW